MGRKTPVDETTALREATREAHEAIQALKEERRLCAEERGRLDADKEDLTDMVAAIWDARMSVAVEEALAHYHDAVRGAIDSASASVAERFDRLTDVLMNPQDYGVEEVMGFMEDAKAHHGGKSTALEDLIYSKVAEFTRGGAR